MHTAGYNHDEDCLADADAKGIATATPSRNEDLNPRSEGCDKDQVGRGTESSGYNGDNSEASGVNGRV